MTFLDYISLLPIFLGFWVSLDLIVFGIKRAVGLFKALSK